MLVNWKGGDRLLTVPLIDVTKPVSMDAALNHDQVVLYPGWNELPPGVFEIMLPHIRGRLDDRSIEYYAKKERIEEEVEVVGKDPESGKKTTKKEIQVKDVYVDQALEEVRADKAREIVRGCFNMKNLVVWAENPRLQSEIRNLVDMQINQIKNYSGEVTEEMMTF